MMTLMTMMMVTTTAMITSMMKTANMIMIMEVKRDDNIGNVVDKLDDLDKEEDITEKKEEAKQE